MQINQCIQAYADEPPLGKRPLRYIHFNNNHQNITMDLCLNPWNQALAITIEINKPVMMSETHPLFLYVLASQSSHDYTQDAYKEHRSKASHPRLRCQNNNQGPCTGIIQTTEQGSYLSIF